MWSTIPLVNFSPFLSSCSTCLMESIAALHTNIAWFHLRWYHDILTKFQFQLTGCISIVFFLKVILISKFREEDTWLWPLFTVHHWSLDCFLDNALHFSLQQRPKSLSAWICTNSCSFFLLVSKALVSENWQLKKETLRSDRCTCVVSSWLQLALRAAQRVHRTDNVGLSPRSVHRQIYQRHRSGLGRWIITSSFPFPFVQSLSTHVLPREQKVHFQLIKQTFIEHVWQVLY